MHTLGEMAKTLNRSAVFLHGLQDRFDLPKFEGATYSEAYFAFLRTLVFLRILNVSEGSLRELWNLEKKLLQLFQLLSAKPVIYACNVAEGDLATAEENPFVKQVAAFVKAHHDAAYVPISAHIEAELIDLSPEEAKEFLKDLGVTDSGVSQLIKGTYGLLGLQTYFTAGEKEVRCWTIKKGWKAPQAAGVIHTDFEKGFIKAEVVAYDDLTRLGSTAAARDAGKYRIEGKEYVFQDGDVVLFRFNN